MADPRTYIRVHDGMPDHPKVDGLSDAAFRLLVTTWCWCSRHLTDGHVPSATWKKRGTPKARRELIGAGLVGEVDGGVVMHDYLEHQRSAEEVQEIREARGKGGALGNHIKWHARRGITKPGCEFCGDRPSDPKDVANGSQDRSVERDGERSQNGNASQNEGLVLPKSERDSESGADDTSEALSSEVAENSVAKRSQDRSLNDRKTSPETVTETEVLMADAGDPPPRRNPGGNAEEEAKSAEPKDGIDAVIAEVKSIRPEWSVRSIHRALTRPAVAERPPAVVRSAALAVAHDRTSTAPGRLEHDGPWWRLPEPLKPPPPVRAEPWDNLAPLGQRDNDEANSRGRAAVDAERAKARAAKGGGP